MAISSVNRTFFKINHYSRLDTYEQRVPALDSFEVRAASTIMRQTTVTLSRFVLLPPSSVCFSPRLHARAVILAHKRHPTHKMFLITLLCCTLPTALRQDYIWPQTEDDGTSTARTRGTYLRTGDVFQFFHKESQSYLSAEGAFKDATSPVGSSNPWLQMDVHLRHRQAELKPPSQLTPPTSAVSFFQVEGATPSDGFPVSWNSHIRLRHLTTQMYLSIATANAVANGEPKNWGVTLTCDGTSQDALFQFVPVGNTGADKDKIPSDARLYIQHIETKTWLHSIKEEDFPRPDTEHDVFGLARVSKSSRGSINFAALAKWDGGELHKAVFQNTVEDIANQQNAFSVHRVPDENVYSVGFLVGCLPMMRQYCSIRKARAVPKQDAIDMAKTLNELTMFLAGHKHRKKLLRDLKVTDVLVKMIQAPFSKLCVKKNPQETKNAIEHLLTNASDEAIDDYNDIILPTHVATLSVMNAAFRVLDTLLQGNSRKDELYVSRHVPFLWSMFGTEMEVEPSFIELVRDNIQIIHFCGEQEIKHIVELLETNKSADFLEFLSVLSVCEGMPVKDMQDIIGEILLSVDEPPVFLTDVHYKEDGSPDGTVNVKIAKDAQPRKLHEFAKSALDEKDDTSTPEYLFLQRQLELYGNLCKGRNKQNIDYITKTHKHLTWAECFICMQSPSGRPGELKLTKAQFLMCPQMKEETGKPDMKIHWAKQSKYAHQKNLETIMDMLSKADVILEKKSISSKSSSGHEGIYSPNDFTPNEVGLNPLPQSLRKIYVDIVIDIFVDVGENRDMLSEIDLSYDWNTELQTSLGDEAKEDQTLALSGARFYNFPELKKWIGAVLSGTSAMIHNDPIQGQPKNRLLHSVLALLHKLIVFGYYADPEDITALMKPLSGVISGLNDFDTLKQASGIGGFGGFENSPSPDQQEQYDTWRCGPRYEVDDTHGRVVCDSKFKALACVEALYNYAFNVRLRYLMCDFKLVYRLAHATDERLADNANLKSGTVSIISKSSLMEAEKRTQELRQFKDFLVKMMSEGEVSISAELTETSRKYLLDLSDQCNWIAHKDWRLEMGTRHATVPNGHSLVGILFDLAKYKDTRLLSKSLQLIDRMYSGQQNLFDLAVQAVALKAPLSKQLVSLKRLLPKLRRLGSRNISGTDVDEFNSILMYITSKCYWEEDEQKQSQPSDRGSILLNGKDWGENWQATLAVNRTNQEIIFNTTIVPFIIGVIHRKGQPCSVLRHSFWFLKAICLGFEKVQVFLYDSLDMMLATTAPEHKSNEDEEDEKKFESWENSMGACIYEIFNNCRDTWLVASCELLAAGWEWPAFHTMNSRACSDTRAHVE